MTTTKQKLITADELLMMPEDGNRYELIRGVLIQKMPPGNPYGSVRAEIGYKLESDPDTVRAPDVSWIAPGRITESIPGYPELVPDLAVEVKSPGNSNPEMAAKAQMWLSYGSLMALVLNPENTTVIIYRANTEPATYGEDDTLDLGDLLPGFACPVWRLFRQQR